MSDSLLLLFSVMLPFVGAALPLVAARRRPDLAPWVSLPVPVLSFVGFLTLTARHNPEALTPASFTLPWIPSLGLDFALFAPGFSLFFALLVSGIGVLVFTYALGYMKGDPCQPRFFACLLMFEGAMLGMATSANLLLLFVFWELTSISSYLLIGYLHEKEKGRFGAQSAFLITGAGALAMLGGIILLSIEMARLNELHQLGIAASQLLHFDTLYIHAPLLGTEGRFSGVILGLILFGAFSKSAQAPFHIWLPGAMEAPTPVSTYLHSATMVKAGLFLIARLVPVFSISVGTGWFLTLGYVGLFTFVLGAILAYFADDIKAVLAYTTISQLGLITAVYGHATFLDNHFDIYHILNHAAYKAPLFMVAGIIYHEMHTRSISRMRGLGRHMPITCAISVVAGLALAGLPPTTGFVSKELFLKSLVKLWDKGIYSSPIELILAVIGAAFIVAVALRLTVGIFFSSPLPTSHSTREVGKGGGDDEHDDDHHSSHHPPHDPSWVMWLPPAALASLVLIGFFLPTSTERLVVHLLEARTVHSPIDPVAHIFYFWHGINLPLIATLTAVVLGIILYARHGSIAGHHTPGALRPWRPWFDALADLRPSLVFRRNIEQLARRAGLLTGVYLRGDVTWYVAITFTMFALSIILTVLATFPLTALEPERLMLGMTSLGSMALFIGMLVSVFGVLWVRQRLAMVIIASIAGYLTALFYVVYRAPDLALTQLLIETISITLFLITFRLLPGFGQQDDKPTPTERHLKKFVACLVGFAAFLVTWAIVENPLQPSISPFFMLNTIDAAGGGNAVNTILVDFRAYDTLAEVAVLAIALVGAAVLLSRRSPRLSARPSRPPQPTTAA